MGDALSQAEIDALLNGGQSDVSSTIENEQLTPQEIDALGEIGNISMGTSATALSNLLGEQVQITTPKVSLLTWEQLTEQNPKPYIIVKVEYTEGLVGSNLLILNVEDAKKITSLMMGQGSEVSADEEITELHLSAISEAMNQMVGSASTSVSAMIGKKRIDISPPVANMFDFAADGKKPYNDIYGTDKIVKIAFRIVIGEVIDSEIMQLLPISFAKELVKSMVSSSNQADDIPIQVAEPIKPTAQPVQQQTFSVQDSVPYENVQIKAPVQHTPPVNVQPVQFQALDEMHYGGDRENIGLIMDVPLQVTVELGRTTKLIREVLEFGPGSIVELDKLAGEPVDILVNSKVIAKGEVVVIDESFGIRITDIVHPSKRI